MRDERRLVEIVTVLPTYSLQVELRAVYLGCHKQKKNRIKMRILYNCFQEEYTGESDKAVD